MSLQKKNILTFIVIIFTLSLFFNIIAEAAEPTTEVQKARQALKDLKDKLMDTSWNISLMETGKKNSIEDIISFKDRKVSSDTMLKEGFKPSNFTIRVKGGNRVIWETMQSSDDKGVSFWRGDIIEEGGTTIMRGVLSWHIDDKNVKDYSFESEPLQYSFTKEASGYQKKLENSKKEKLELAEKAKKEAEAKARRDKEETLRIQREKEAQALKENAKEEAVESTKPEENVNKSEPAEQTIQPVQETKPEVIQKEEVKEEQKDKPKWRFW